jgi:hypothetical protein
MSLTPVENLPPVSLTTVANFPPVSTTPAVLMAKFAAGVVYTGGKVATCVADNVGVIFKAIIIFQFNLISILLCIYFYYFCAAYV